MTLNIMINAISAEISEQLVQAMDVIEHHLASALLAVHLYGSALDGGLKPYSDIDLLVTVVTRPEPTVRQALMRDLLKMSAPPGHNKNLRALEVTLVVHSDIVPWRYPARREMQFGEWLRDDVLAGNFEPAVIDPDLAILLMKVRQHGVALVGPLAMEFFDPVPAGDLLKALADTLTLWNTPSDWAGDERNVVLTLARVWYSAATGMIAPKDVAADWAFARLPEAHRSVLAEAQQVYLRHRDDHVAMRGDQLTEFVMHVKREVTHLLDR